MAGLHVGMFFLFLLMFKLKVKGICCLVGEGAGQCGMRCSMLQCPALTPSWPSMLLNLEIVVSDKVVVGIQSGGHSRALVELRLPGPYGIDRLSERPLLLEIMVLSPKELLSS